MLTADDASVLHVLKKSGAERSAVETLTELADLHVHSQVGHVTVAAAAAVPVARAQQDLAAQDAHATIAPSR